MLLRSSKRTRPENLTLDYEAQKKKRSRSINARKKQQEEEREQELQCSLEATNTTTISPPSSPKNIRSLKKPLAGDNINNINNNNNTTKANQDNEAEELEAKHSSDSTSETSDDSNNSLVVPPGMISAEDIGNLFECPICFEDMLPPIYQCSRGHLICSSCRTKVCRCPSCRESLVDKVCNLALAQLAERIVNSKCKYWKEVQVALTRCHTYRRPSMKNAANSGLCVVQCLRASAAGKARQGTT